MDVETDIVAKLMAISAVNTHREDMPSRLDVTVLDEAEREILVEEMFQMAEKNDDEIYSQMGESIRNSKDLILVGLDDDTTLGLDCQACGFSSCEELSKIRKEDIFEGPNCVFRVIDLGIAVGSALRTANVHNVKGEVMIKGGIAAKRVGLSTSRVVLAVPIYID